MTTMEYETNHFENSDAPAPSKRKAKPRIHEHEIHGPMIAADIRTYYEQLQADEDEATGAAKRFVANRRWLLGMFLAELEAFHGIEGGGL